MEIQIQAQNIKCAGCVSAITQGLLEDSRIDGVEVDIDSGRVSVQAGEDIREVINARLRELGYPPKD